MDRSDPGLAAGIDYLSDVGPSANDMYYNYYATQVMHHRGGPLWEKWDTEMRDQLLRTQDRVGHKTGSWHFADPHGGGKGGRLYSTTMAAMTLEVYYRNAPMYRKAAVEEDFPL